VFSEHRRCPIIKLVGLSAEARLDVGLVGFRICREPWRAGYTKTALEILERYGNPRKLRRLGVNRLTVLMRGTSGGQWSTDKGTELIAAADEAIALWEHD
jgi:hypothetical protein